MKDPRIGNLSPKDAVLLKKLAEEMGGLDCMPVWMREEIEKKVIDKQANLDYSGGILDYSI